MAKVYPVIMSGGIGSRLWPLSRRARPKQFAPLFDGQSLFQATVERVRTIQGFEDLIIVTGRDHARFVAQQLDALKVNAQIVLEPAGRESAPAIAAAAALIAQKDENAVAVVVASDHLIPDHDHFRRDCNRAVEIAETDRIVTLGIKPSHPSDAYGYIQPQQPDKPVSPVAKFVEKPNEVTAQTYLEQGFLWNSGNFIAKASTLVTAFAQLAPDVLGPVEAAVQAARITADGMLLGDAFVDAQKISMDYAIMEKTDQASVLRSTFEWSDLGAWDSLYTAADKDSQENAFTGDVMAFDSERCAVRSKDGTLTVLLGVSDINVVVDEDVVLVSAHSAAQRTKDVVAALQRDGRPEIEGASTDSGLEELSGWFQTWLATAAFPLWATAGFDYDLGIWRENLDQTGRPTNAPIRARVQGRQNTVFAIAGRQGWPGPWQDLLSRARLGAEQHFNLPTGDHTGLMRGEIFADGQP
ncbi:MAG: sugar phosphate nucleotidyltransferase, partial [Pseudomonadota bacterium]